MARPDRPRPWTLSCLLCDDFEETDLVAIQEHAMLEHDVTPDHLRLARRLGPVVLGDGTEIYTWQLPADAGGEVWLRSRRRLEE